jgi:hypothetical protein
VGEIGIKEGHLAGRPVIHVANRPLPLSPQIPYLRDAIATSSPCAIESMILVRFDILEDMYGFGCLFHIQCP